MLCKSSELYKLAGLTQSILLRGNSLEMEIHSIHNQVLIGLSRCSTFTCYYRCHWCCVRHPCDTIIEPYNSEGSVLLQKAGQGDSHL